MSSRRPCARHRDRGRGLAAPHAPELRVVRKRQPREAFGRHEREGEHGAIASPAATSCTSDWATNVLVGTAVSYPSHASGHAFRSASTWARAITPRRPAPDARAVLGVEEQEDPSRSPPPGRAGRQDAGQPHRWPCWPSASPRSARSLVDADRTASTRSTRSPAHGEAGHDNGLRRPRRPGVVHERVIDAAVGPSLWPIRPGAWAPRLNCHDVVARARPAHGCMRVRGWGRWASSGTCSTKPNGRPSGVKRTLVWRLTLAEQPHASCRAHRSRHGSMRTEGLGASALDSTNVCTVESARTTRRLARRHQDPTLDRRPMARARSSAASRPMANVERDDGEGLGKNQKENAGQREDRAEEHPRTGSRRIRGRTPSGM